MSQPSKERKEGRNVSGVKTGKASSSPPPSLSAEVRGWQQRSVYPAFGRRLPYDECSASCEWERCQPPMPRTAAHPAVCVRGEKEAPLNPRAPSACSPRCPPVAAVCDALFCDFMLPWVSQLAPCLIDITLVSNGHCDFSQECRGSYGHLLVQATSLFSQISRAARANAIASLRNKS